MECVNTAGRDTYDTLLFPCNVVAASKHSGDAYSSVGDARVSATSSDGLFSGD